MSSRMEKYHSKQDDSIKTSNSRLSKNENLYEKINTNKVFTEFVSGTPDNVIDLGEVTSGVVNSREKYQKTRFLNQDEEERKSNSFVDKEVVYEDKREKNYNINDILENARKNRTEEDEIEKKRRLKSVEYSILSDLSHEKVKEYHDSKQKKLSKEEEENLEELIHTITSNSLRKKIDDELLGDLLPSDEEEETVGTQELMEKVEEIKEKTEDLKETLDEIDDSFYTRSMDLSDQDFENDEDDTSFLDDKKMGIVPKILIGLFVVAVVAIIIYVVYKFI